MSKTVKREKVSPRLSKRLRALSQQRTRLRRRLAALSARRRALERRENLITCDLWGRVSALAAVKRAQFTVDLQHSRVMSRFDVLWSHHRAQVRTRRGKNPVSIKHNAARRRRKGEESSARAN